MRRARGVLIGIVALCPAVFVAGSGCSSSSSSSGGDGVDPGGVFGAEVSVTVIGRGRVTTSIPGVNCPGICTSRFVYKSSSEPGADKGVTLKAITTNPAVRFAGWKFEPTALGTRGRGPESCNPVVRDSAIPVVDTNNPEITLSFGTTNGRPPAGQEGACGGFTEVPTAYNVTATFVDQSIVDAGPDVITDGDAASPDVFFESPVANAVAREIGFISPYLYWRFDVAGNSGIAYAQASSLSTPSVIFPAALPSTQPITIFNVGTHVVFQTSDNVLRVIQGGGNFPVTLPGAPACVAVASDASYAYCRTAGPTGQILQWTIGGSGPTILYNDVPTGTDLWADPSASTSTYLYFSNSTAGSIHYALKSTVDGGPASFLTLTTGQTTPYGIVGNTSRVFWMNGSATASSVHSVSSRTGSPIVYQAVPLQAGARIIAPDTSVSSLLQASNGTISRHSYSSTLTNVPTRTGLPQINGMTMDSSLYVYWTQNDGGRVYRAVRQ